ncbi:SusD/RagB family nutrient-binding outer membrane lipoprotein [Lacinutrix sp. Hel_I_90]|uniref:SusD/RagB family nutrient-binding outer membrane lipoprotein n=1 Tax=Lacinutrix sp. Hel_I_90 TaxID=1249999 RepID=UPI0005C890FD|nr:SusD/RagB family nutrient-binding outer membrane lipoprotein [Lacinutrix sp. Hel_I_90]
MKKYIKTGIALLFVGALFNSCESTLDINESEVGFTTDAVSPDLLLAGAIQAPRTQFEVTTSELGSIFMNQWAGDINNVTGGFQDEFRLNITQNFYGSIWNNLYRGMGTYQTIIDSEGDAYNNHKAIARILKSYYFQYIVDLYGNAPYSQALQGGELLTPAYDDAQAIYRALVADVNIALATLANSSEYLPVGAEDTVFQGNLNGWIEVANTLKLRLLLRQSEMTDADTTTYLATEFASLAGGPFVTANATLNPGYVNENGKLNPFWANYGFDVAGNPTFDRDFIVPSEYFEKFLKGENQTDADFNVGALPGTGVNDTRLVRFFDPASGVPGNGVTGVVQGAENSQAPSQLSEPGPGLLRSFDQDSYIFTASESFFLQAEAIEKGYLTGSAQTMFENGIIASFDLLGATGSATYLTNSANVNRIGWNGSANKIEAIMTQKWIALCGFNAIESFIDYNRTGFPNVPLSVVATKPQLPYRLLYPTSEYSTNSANVPNQPVSNAFSSKIFWDVN